MFAFYMNDIKGGSGNKQGMLTLGGVDQKYYTGEITWAPVIRQAYWEVRMDTIKLGDQDLAISHGAAIDSGTFLVGWWGWLAS